jgi:hypothetical protein
MHIRIQGEQETLCVAAGVSMEITRSEFNRHPDCSPFGPQISEHDRCPDCLKAWRERYPNSSPLPALRQLARDGKSG